MDDNCDAHPAGTRPAAGRASAGRVPRPCATHIAAPDQRTPASEPAHHALPLWGAVGAPGVAAIRRGLGPAAVGNVHPPDPLHDADVRRALLAALGVDGVWAPDHAADDAFVVEEMALRGGYVRADVAVVSTTGLHVYEIKSDRDRLDRLPEQARLYGEVADRVTLVVGWSHAVAVMRRAPAWWEVWLAERGAGGAVALVPLRDGSPNPHVCARAVAALLSRDAALSYLAELGADAGVRSKPRAELCARIAAALRGPPEGQTDLGPLRRRVHAYWSRRATRPAPAWWRYGD